MLRSAAFIVFAVSCVICAFAESGNLVLARRGHVPDCAIVVSRVASKTEMYAAKELCEFTQRATGVRLPIVAEGTPTLPRKAIVLRCGDANECVATSPDSFRLFVEDGRLFISGGSPRGVLYGVYEVLERFAECRWYASWHTVVPRIDMFAVPGSLDETQRPAFEMRDAAYYDVVHNGAFAARLKINTLGWQFEMDEKYGGNPFLAGDSGHTMGMLLPSKVYFRDHPEFFSMNGGGVREDAQPCLTNPDVAKIVTSNLIERIRENPRARIFSVSQNDNTKYCLCPNCRAIYKEEESPAGTLIRFVNDVAAKVEGEFPDIIIHTFAYQYTRSPPKVTKARHNVMVQLCPLECDFARPLVDSKADSNVAFVKCLKSWSRKADVLSIFDYTANFAHYTIPWPNAFSLQGNLKYYRDNGITLMFSLGDYQGRHGDFAELKAWLLAKWMWNPDLPMEGLLDDFFAGYYGKAAPFVRKWFDETHRRQTSIDRSGRQHALGTFDGFYNSALSDDFVEKSRRLWRLAQDAVEDDPATSYNVRMSAFSFDCMRMLRMCRRFDLTGRRSNADFAKEAQSLARSLLARMDEAKDIRLGEGAPGCQAKKKKWRDIAEGTMPELISANGGMEFEDRHLSLSGAGKCGLNDVDDLKASDGKAIKIFNTHYDWCVFLHMGDIVFEPNARYRLRARVRVDKARDAGEAFWAGVYNYSERRNVGRLTAPRTDGMSDDYAWYDICTWTPTGDEAFWIGPGRFGADGKSAVNAVYVDKVDLYRAD